MVYVCEHYIDYYPHPLLMENRFQMKDFPSKFEGWYLLYILFHYVWRRISSTWYCPTEGRVWPLRQWISLQQCRWFVPGRHTLPNGMGTRVFAKMLYSSSPFLKISSLLLATICGISMKEKSLSSLSIRNRTTTLWWQQGESPSRIINRLHRWAIKAECDSPSPVSISIRKYETVL